MKPKLTQRKQAKNIIPTLHNNNRSEIKQSKVETTMMLAVIHRQNSTHHLKCYSVVHPLNFWQYRPGIHLKTCQQHLYTFLHAAWCLTEYVKDFCKMKNKMKILSVTQHWINEQRDRSLEHVTSCEFPNHAQCKKYWPTSFWGWLWKISYDLIMGNFKLLLQVVDTAIISK